MSGSQNGARNPATDFHFFQYNRDLDEPVYAEQLGFDGVVINEQHANLVRQMMDHREVEHGR